MNPSVYEQLNRREEGQAATPYDTLGWRKQTFKKSIIMRISKREIPKKACSEILAASVSIEAVHQFIKKLTDTC